MLTKWAYANCQTNAVTGLKKGNNLFEQTLKIKTDLVRKNSCHIMPSAWIAKYLHYLFLGNWYWLEFIFLLKKNRSKLIHRFGFEILMYMLPYECVLFLAFHKHFFMFTINQLKQLLIITTHTRHQCCNMLWVKDPSKKL